MKDTKLRDLCCKNNWFTNGDCEQYKKLFLLNGDDCHNFHKNHSHLVEITAMIWICSEDTSYDSIMKELLRSETITDRKMGLIRGRHEIPDVDDYVFDDTIADVTDLSAMESIIARKLDGCETLDLYVTGLTVALVEVIKYCNRNSIYLTLWHYNAETGEYFPQKV